MKSIKIHLKRDLGLNKSTIKKSYLDDASHLPASEHKERGFDEVKNLLNRRTQLYTIEEVKVLTGCYLTSHDYCVVDNTGNGEFSPLQEYKANEKYDTMLRAEKILVARNDALKEACSEALDRFNGYWANDYTVCDEVADKYAYNRTEFSKEVYKKANFK